MPGVTANANPPTQGSKYRIKVGQTIGALVWSNIATTVKGFWTILYDDGSPDYWPMVETASGSSRATVLAPTSQVAKKNGWVVDGYVGVNTPTVPQRGQVYVQAIIVDPNLSVTSAVIACGYAYAGHLVNIGTFVEPGPAGGQGAMTSQALSAPAAGVDYASNTVPAGAFWKLRGFFGQLVTGAGVANREFAIQYSDATQVKGGGVASELQTATLTVDYIGGVGMTSSGVSAQLGGGVTAIGFSDTILMAADIIVHKTYNIQGLDQWSVGRQIVEEWVVPN